MVSEPLQFNILNRLIIFQEHLYDCIRSYLYFEEYRVRDTFGGFPNSKYEQMLPGPSYRRVTSKFRVVVIFTGFSVSSVFAPSWLTIEKLELPTCTLGHFFLLLIFDHSTLINSITNAAFYYITGFNDASYLPYEFRW